MQIRVLVGDRAFSATLLNTEASRDFAALLPLTLTLSDYAGTEKVSDLPKRLSTAGAPDGHRASVGDITYYAPWTGLAIFYRPFGYATGLVNLGRLDAGIDEFARMVGHFPVTFEFADQPEGA